jgi:hypothetical protein
MKTYTTNDGERVSGNTSRDVIKALRQLSHAPEVNRTTFMAAVAFRVEAQTGSKLNTQSEASFIAGLIQLGLLKEEQ